MAEYHYFGADGNQRDPQAAADLYCNAAINGDPQVKFRFCNHIPALQQYTLFLNIQVLNYFSICVAFSILGIFTLFVFSLFS